jgi:hypothetical protein
MLTILTPSQIGDISEAIVRARFIEKGYVVLVPQNSALRYDIVVEKDGIFQRVQIKTGRFHKGAVVFNAASQDPNDRSKKITYRGVIDAFAIYCHELQTCYLLRVEDASTMLCHLRITAPKNNQLNGIRWAADYEF